ncbi:hypothetical protein ACFU8W_38640 [Streptomyces sp. NPDC057565]|uniref:hypothetical protein n=1 Tax=Streptomyces sp. NPDC057565 TaxID=3346169 RepID=UPI0036CEF840
MTDALEVIERAAAEFAVACQAADTADATTYLAELPVPARLVLAAAVIAAADKPVSIVSLCEVAAVSRGSAYNHHKARMNHIRETVPVLVRALLERLETSFDSAILYEQLRERDESIQRLRAQLVTNTKERDAALAYARALHERLRPEIEAIALEQREKVRHLWRVTEDEEE